MTQLAASTAKFERLEHVFNADGSRPWLHSHASNPTPVHLRDDVFRIFFSSRNKDKQSHIGYLDYDIEKRKLLAVAKDPVLVPGAAGFFDDSGVSVGCVTKDDRGNFGLYYVGWNLAPNVPFRNSIGVARGADLSAFAKHSPGPMMDRSFEDPLSMSYPWVLRDAQGWRMWYGTHLSWATERYEMVHLLAHATSVDGLNWKRTGLINLPNTEDEFAFSRPCVIHENGRYKMWFSVRGEKYSIGYAESEDGLNWQRGDMHIGGSGEGWDSDSASYAAVFDHRSERYALYCGNNYGATGFGLALLK